MRCMGGAARGSGESVRARCVARCTRTTTQSISLPAVPTAMADWSLVNREWGPQYDPYQYQYPLENQPQPPQPPQPYPPQAQQYYPLPTSIHVSPPQLQPPAQLPAPLPGQLPVLQYNPGFVPQRENPREIRNKAEKQRRDKLNHSIAELASMVPPVVASSRKIDKTGVLRLTAHYLRAHQYVFGDSIGQGSQEFNTSTTQAILGVLNGFLLTTTYKGLIVVVSQNVHQYLGYTELELLGQNLFNIVHKDDHRLLREQLSPKSYMLGPNGELLVPDEPDGKQKVEAALANEKRSFIVRFKKFSQRSEPDQFVMCHVQGSLRKSDRACRGYNRCCQMVRRARARGDNPCSSGNDVVFIGVVRPTSETFITESVLESFRMEYRTRHSIDGEIIQCEQRIAVVTGYMTHEVNGVNAMNFMHRDDVRWVIIALREMYDKHRLFGESCYRLMTKNGQFVYMRTRGRLDVDQDSRATSFVCTNTVVEKQEGEHLIKMMKKKFTLMVNNNEEPPPEDDHKDVSENQSLPVEDPRQLEKVILHLVTNLPSPQPEEPPGGGSPDRGTSPPLRIAIIPPRKERIVSAIEKIYSVIKTFQRQPRTIKEIENMDHGMNINNDKPGVPKSQTTVQPYGLGEPSRRLMSAISSGPLMEAPPPNERQISGPINQITNYQNVTAQRDAIYENPAGPSSGAAMPVHSGTYAGMASLSFENMKSKIVDNSNEPSTTKIKYHVFIAPQHENEQKMKITELSTGPQPGFNSGIKRPNIFVDPNVGVKKKIVEAFPAVQEQPIDQPSGRNSPNLAEILDEALSDTQLSQIDSALTSLEQTIDPSFPDLLISQEVQDLLGEFEEETDLNQRSDRNNGT